MNLKKLKINNNLIPTTLKSILGKEIKPTLRNNNGCCIHKYQLNTDSILDIYYNNDGTTTFSPIGKNKEYSQTIAEKIIHNCQVELPEPTRALYIKKITQQELDKILTHLKESGCTIKQLTNINNCKKYEINNSIGENIKIHYYDSGALNFQGKGYSIYNNILTSLDTIISLDEVLESCLKSNNIENITPKEIIESMEKAFVSSFNFINGAISNIISASFFLTKIENNHLIDYSWMVFPILRGVEGFLKKILMTNGLRINKNFAEIFEPIALNSTIYRIIPSKHNNFSPKLTKKAILALENCYNFMVKNRHGIFHMDTIVDSSRLINREEALIIFNESIQLIESSYIDITSIT